MPKCDRCKKEVKDIHGSVMTYKHSKGLTGFICGDCAAEMDFDKVNKKGREIVLSALLEEESKEKGVLRG